MAKKAGKFGEIRVWPESDAWVTAMVFVFLGVGTTTLARTQPNAPPLAWPAALGIGAVCALPGLLLFAALCRSAVFAADNGLCARGIYKQTMTPWDEIGDFYTVPPNRSRDQNEMKLRPNAFVLDRSGHTIAGFRVRAKNAHLLQARIAERAVNAQTRTWQLKGTRSFDPWPRVFGYDTCENRSQRRGFFIWGIIAAAFWSGLAFFDLGKSFARHDFGWWAVGAALVRLFIGGSQCLLLVVVYQIVTGRTRAGESFLVDWDGFTFDSPNGSHRVLWGNVTSYGYAPDVPPPASRFSLVAEVPPCRLQTESQGAFDFTSGLGDCVVFRELVRLRATNAAQTGWPAPPLPARDVLGGEALRWSGKCEGVGERVFHYRTRMARAFLWLTGVFAGAFGLSWLTGWLGLTKGDNSPVPLFLGGMNALFLAWCVWRYYAAHIRVGEAGLTQKTPWGETFIAWADLRSVHCSNNEQPFAAKIQGANGHVIRWTPDFLAGEAELKSLLQTRCPATE